MESVPTGGFGDVLGLRYPEVSASRVVVEWDVTEAHLQPFGIVHGGVFCSVVETAASYGGQVWFGERGHIVGMNNQTDFLRPGRPENSPFRAVAEPIHQGQRSQLWLVEIFDATEKMLARGQVRLANLEHRD